MVLLDAKTEISSSEIISSLNRSSSVASELPHVWFVELDADLGWVTAGICLTNLLRVR